jgi:hypothetical protein
VLVIQGQGHGQPAQVLGRGALIAETPGKRNHLLAGPEPGYSPCRQVCDPRVGLEQRQPLVIANVAGTPECPRVLARRFAVGVERFGLPGCPRGEGQDGLAIPGRLGVVREPGQVGFGAYD